MRISVKKFSVHLDWSENDFPPHLDIDRYEADIVNTLQKIVKFCKSL